MRPRIGHMKKKQQAHIIIDEAGMRAGLRALRRICPHMRRIHDRTGDPPLRDYRPGFAGLARIVVGQQVSLASAQAIWGRLQAAVQPLTAEAFLLADDATLRAVGLSSGKVRTLRGIGTAIANGFDLEGLTNAPEATVHEQLTSLSGIGPWTADIYALFCLGRADAFASGDLALQTVTRLVMELDSRPSRDELLASRSAGAPGVGSQRTFCGRTIRSQTERCFSRNPRDFYDLALQNPPLAQHLWSPSQS